MLLPFLLNSYGAPEEGQNSKGQQSLFVFSNALQNNYLESKWEGSSYQQKQPLIGGQ